MNPGNVVLLIPRPVYDRLLDFDASLLQRAHAVCKRRKWGLGGCEFEFKARDHWLAENLRLRMLEVAK